MTPAAIIEQAQSLGVRLWAAGDKIKYRGPSEALTHLVPLLRAHKPAILATLSETRLNPAETSGHWLILQPPQWIEKYFSPDITRAELMERYPGALLVFLPDTTDPLPPQYRAMLDGS